jgi:hypothetical protein
MQVPGVGDMVHYLSFGTPNGEYPSVCRAAIITDVDHYQYPDEHTGFVGHVSLCVLNPEGMFFKKSVLEGNDEERKGGTWHWPEQA